MRKYQPMVDARRECQCKGTANRAARQTADMTATAKVDELAKAWDCIRGTWCSIGAGREELESRAKRYRIGKAGYAEARPITPWQAKLSRELQGVKKKK